MDWIWIKPWGCITRKNLFFNNYKIIMKKKTLLAAAYLMMGTAVAFTSCNNDDVVDNIDLGAGVAETQVLTLQVASADAGLTTRAGRPLLSSAAAQQIDQVALYFVKDGQLFLKKWVDWKTATPYADGKQLEIALKKENNQKLEEGTYQVYAVGYSGKDANGTDYTFTPGAMFSDEGNVVNAEAWSEFQATLKADVKYAEEVFAGVTTVTVEKNGAFKMLSDGKKNNIVLHRQVAGATGYFNNIPVSVDGRNARYVRLVASAKNNTVLFENFNTEFISADKAGFKYIVNGANAATPNNDVLFANGNSAFTVYQIDLSSWFKKDPNYKGKDYKGYDYNKDGFLGTDDVKEFLADKELNSANDYADIWVNANYYKGQSVYRGTVFGAEFVIPVAYVDGQNTLQLQVTDEAGNVLKYWNINVKEDQLHLQQPATQAVASGEKFDKSKSIFNLYRNHMYSVGMKANNTVPGGPTPTPDPENPTPTPDPEIPEKPEELPDGEKPTDLSKGQDLIIYVNSNWEVIHDMEID